VGNYQLKDLKVHSKRITHLGNDLLVINGKEEVSRGILFHDIPIDCLEDCLVCYAFGSFLLGRSFYVDSFMGFMVLKLVTAFCTLVVSSLVINCVASNSSGALFPIDGIFSEDFSVFGKGWSCIFIPYPSLCSIDGILGNRSTMDHLG
jgi:hypothetical protein